LKNPGIRLFPGFQSANLIWGNGFAVSFPVFSFLELGDCYSPNTGIRGLEEVGFFIFRPLFQNIWK
jgi:hypothetical protein